MLCVSSTSEDTGVVVTSSPELYADPKLALVDGKSVRVVRSAGRHCCCPCGGLAFPSERLVLPGMLTTTYAFGSCAAQRVAFSCARAIQSRRLTSTPREHHPSFGSPLQQSHVVLRGTENIIWRAGSLRAASLFAMLHGRECGPPVHNSRRGPRCRLGGVTDDSVFQAKQGCCSTYVDQASVLYDRARIQQRLSCRTRPPRGSRSIPRTARMRHLQRDVLHLHAYGHHVVQVCDGVCVGPIIKQSSVPTRPARSLCQARTRLMCTCSPTPYCVLQRTPGTMLPTKEPERGQRQAETRWNDHVARHFLFQNKNSIARATSPQKKTTRTGTGIGVLTMARVWLAFLPSFVFGLCCLPFRPLPSCAAWTAYAWELPCDSVRIRLCCASSFFSSNKTCFHFLFSAVFNFYSENNNVVHFVHRFPFLCFKKYVFICVSCFCFLHFSSSRFFFSYFLHYSFFIWFILFRFFIFLFALFSGAMRFRVAALALGLSLQPPYQRAGCIVRSFCEVLCLHPPSVTVDCHRL